MTTRTDPFRELDRLAPRTRPRQAQQPTHVCRDAHTYAGFAQRSNDCSAPDRHETSA